MKEIKAQYIGKGKKVCLVASRFNEFITRRLVEGAADCLQGHGVGAEAVTAVWVPGSFEVPPAAARAAASGKYDAVICLGALIRGETPHFEYLSQQVCRGVAELALGGKVPVIFGIVTADTLEQAIERAGTKMGNKGWDAALTALEMINLYEAF